MTIEFHRKNTIILKQIMWRLDTYAGIAIKKVCLKDKKSCWKAV